MRQRPLLLPLAALMSGAIAANSHILFGGWPLAIFLLIGAVAAYSCARNFLALLLISLVGAVSANLLTAERLKPPSVLLQLPLWAAEQPAVLVGIVEQRPASVREGCRLVVSIGQAPGPIGGNGDCFRVQVTVGHGTPAVATGDLVRFSTAIKVPRPLELPGEFDRQRYLAWRGIYATAFVAQSSAVEVLTPGVAYPVRRWFDHLAQRLAKEIDANVPLPASGILKALLLGIRGDIPADLEKLYAVTGVNHILSVSGFHVGVLALSLMAVYSWLARRSVVLVLWGNVRRWSALAVLPIIIGYLLLTGMAAATIRSVLMLGAVCVAVMDEREHDHLDTLILAAVVMLAVTPWLLFDVSCQLSFLALWGLLVLTPRFERLFPPVTAPWGQRLVTLIAASLAAILVTAPAVAYYFHLFGFTGIVANLFVVPLMGYGAVVIGFAGLVLSAVVPPMAYWLFGLAGLLVNAANWGVGKCAALPVWRGVSPSLIEVFLITGFVLALSIRQLRCRWAVMVMLVTCGITARFLDWQAANGSLQVTFLSVGQAEATLIRLPSGKSMLIDTGGTPVRDDLHWGERILLPALWRLGVQRLEYVVVTHPHADHSGGLADLAAAMPIGELWCGGTAGDPEWQSLLAVAARHAIPCRLIDGRTPPVMLGQVRIEPFWPLPRGAAGDTNDRSLVFRLGWQEFSILFAGDIGWEVADYLVRANGKQLASTVLKVPHHGSRHSDTPSLYAVVQPHQAVISAGYRNRFGLPSTDTLSSLHLAGVRLLRTDLDGTIRMQVPGGRQQPIIQRHFRHFN